MSAQSTEVPEPIKRLVYERSNLCCELCGSSQIEGLHHRQRRTNVNGVASNLLCLCSRCHHWEIHEHPSRAYAMGWLVHSWDDYHEIPVWVRQGTILSRWLLDDDGMFLQAVVGTGDAESAMVAHDQSQAGG